MATRVAGRASPPDCTENPLQQASGDDLDVAQTDAADGGDEVGHPQRRPTCRRLSGSTVVVQSKATATRLGTLPPSGASSEPGAAGDRRPPSVAGATGGDALSPCSRWRRLTGCQRRSYLHIVPCHKHEDQFQRTDPRSISIAVSVAIPDDPDDNSGGRPAAAGTKSSSLRLTAVNDKKTSRRSGDGDEQ